MIGTARSRNGWATGLIEPEQEATVQRNEHGGGGEPRTDLILTTRVPLRGRGHFGVDGSVARQVTREVEGMEARSREQSWLSSALSHGLSGTRIA